MTNEQVDKRTYVEFRTEQDALAKQVQALVDPFCRKYGLIPQELSFEWDYYGKCRVKVTQ
jgi:hypothetical protein